jgi:hypothetical protein
MFTLNRVPIAALRSEPKLTHNSGASRPKATAQAGRTQQAARHHGRNTLRYGAPCGPTAAVPSSPRRRNVTSQGQTRSDLGLGRCADAALVGVDVLDGACDQERVEEEEQQGHRAHDRKASNDHLRSARTHVLLRIQSDQLVRVW